MVMNSQIGTENCFNTRVTRSMTKAAARRTSPGEPPAKRRTTDVLPMDDGEHGNSEEFQQQQQRQNEENQLIELIKRKLNRHNGQLPCIPKPEPEENHVIVLQMESLYRELENGEKSQQQQQPQNEENQPMDGHQSPSIQIKEPVEMVVHMYDLKEELENEEGSQQQPQLQDDENELILKMMKKLRNGQLPRIPKQEPVENHMLVAFQKATRIQNV